MGLLRCPAPTRLIRILPSLKVREEFNQLLCLGFSTNVFCAFDTIRSPCSISFEPLRFSISGLRLKQFPELFYSQNSRVLETIVFLALFSRRKVSVYSLRFKNRNHSYFFRKADIELGEKAFFIHSERSEPSGLFLFPSAGVTLE